MTREQWLIVRKKEEIPMEVWFEYYQENGGYIQYIGEFERLFSQILGIQQVMIINGQQKELSFGSAVRRIFKYYDAKFEV